MSPPDASLGRHHGDGKLSSRGRGGSPGAARCELHLVPFLEWSGSKGQESEKEPGGKLSTGCQGSSALQHGSVPASVTPKTSQGSKRRPLKVYQAKGQLEARSSSGLASLL